MEMCCVKLDATWRAATKTPGKSVPMTSSIPAPYIRPIRMDQHSVLERYRYHPPPPPPQPHAEGRWPWSGCGRASDSHSLTTWSRSQKKYRKQFSKFCHILCLRASNKPCMIQQAVRHAKSLLNLGGSNPASHLPTLISAGPSELTNIFTSQRESCRGIRTSKVHKTHRNFFRFMRFFIRVDVTRSAWKRRFCNVCDWIVLLRSSCGYEMKKET